MTCIPTSSNERSTSPCMSSRSSPLLATPRSPRPEAPSEPFSDGAEIQVANLDYRMSRKDLQQTLHDTFCRYGKASPSFHTQIQCLLDHSFSRLLFSRNKCPNFLLCPGESRGAQSSHRLSAEGHHPDVEPATGHKCRQRLAPLQDRMQAHSGVPDHWLQQQNSGPAQVQTGVNEVMLCVTETPAAIT